jgi:TPR repeat protein
MKASKPNPTHRAQLLAAQKAARANGLRWNQEQAAKGDAYGMLRMGERYRDGDGVPRDLTKAREYLTKASAAGSLTALGALSRLNQSSTHLRATRPAPATRQSRSRRNQDG